MRTLSTIYVIGMIIMYFVMGGAFTFWVLLFSVFIAAIPLATSNLFFLTPILAMIYFGFFGLDPYDSDFVWLSVLFAPYWFVAIIANVMDLFD